MRGGGWSRNQDCLRQTGRREVVDEAVEQVVESDHFGLLLSQAEPLVAHDDPPSDSGTRHRGVVPVLTCQVRTGRSVISVNCFFIRDPFCWSDSTASGGQFDV